MVVLFGSVFTSCNNDDDLLLAGDSQTELVSSFCQDSVKSVTRGVTAMTYGMEIVGEVPFSDHNLHGIPDDGLASDASIYKFWVSNPTSDITGVDVIFTIPSGGTVTKHMSLNSSGNYYLQQTLSQGGRYGVTYNLLKSGSSQSVTPYGGYIYNTRVDFSGEIRKLVWPFGADGSSWSNRIVSINGSSQSWAGGQEGGPGDGWNQGYHVGNTERYSDDWNRGSGDQDLGVEIRSPLDGYVDDITGYNTDLGYSKRVRISQIAPNGNTYYFYVGHLDTRDVVLGQYVKAGITKIGTIGKSGAVHAHAHCNLRINSAYGNCVKFYFNALQ